MTYNSVKINAGRGIKCTYIDEGTNKYYNPISGGFYGKRQFLVLIIMATVRITFVLERQWYQGPMSQ